MVCIFDGREANDASIRLYDVEREGVYGDDGSDAYIPGELPAVVCRSRVAVSEQDGEGGAEQYDKDVADENDPLGHGRFEEVTYYATIGKFAYDSSAHI